MIKYTMLDIPLEVWVYNSSVETGMWRIIGKILQGSYMLECSQ
jgi:hypothetical protein